MPPLSPGPQAIPVDNGLDLQLIFMSANVDQAVDVSGLILQPDGSLVPFRQVFTIPGPSSKDYFTIPLSNGHLVSLTARASTGPLQRGDLFAIIGISDRQAPQPQFRYVLVADYITVNSPIAWPYGRALSPVEGPGSINRAKPANPAAGADFTFTIPPGQKWRVRGVRWTFVTSAAIATRIPHLELQIGGDILLRIGALSQAASLSGNFYFAPIGSTVDDATTITGARVQPIPLDLLLPSGSTILSTTTAIQAADQISAIVIYREIYQDEQP